MKRSTDISSAAGSLSALTTTEIAVQTAVIAAENSSCAQDYAANSSGSANGLSSSVAVQACTGSSAVLSAATAESDRDAGCRSLPTIPAVTGPSLSSDSEVCSPAAAQADGGSAAAVSAALRTDSGALTNRLFTALRQRADLLRRLVHLVRELRRLRRAVAGVTATI